MYEEKARYVPDAVGGVPMEVPSLTTELIPLIDHVHKLTAQAAELQDRVNRVERQTPIEQLDQQFGAAFMHRARLDPATFGRKELYPYV